jgi:hypothetical protein
MKLNFLKARSTWVAAFTVLGGVLVATGAIEPSEMQAFVDGGSEKAMAAIGAVAALWVYLERTVFSRANNLTLGGD